MATLVFLFSADKHSRLGDITAQSCAQQPPHLGAQLLHAQTHGSSCVLECSQCSSAMAMLVPQRRVLRRVLRRRGRRARADCQGMARGWCGHVCRRCAGPSPPESRCVAAAHWHYQGAMAPLLPTPLLTLTSSLHTSACSGGAARAAACGHVPLRHSGAVPPGIIRCPAVSPASCTRVLLGLDHTSHQLGNAPAPVAAALLHASNERAPSQPLLHYGH